MIVHDCLSLTGQNAMGLGLLKLSARPGVGKDVRDVSSKGEGS
jgi:hypothetical protein